MEDEEKRKGKKEERENERFEMVITSKVCVREKGVNVMVKGKADLRPWE